MSRHHHHRYHHRRLLPLLLSLVVVFITVWTARSRRGLDEDDICPFSTNSNSTRSPRPGTTNTASVVASLVVSSTDAAAQLGEDLLLCPGATFEVKWQGHVQITQSLEVVDGTTLIIAVREYMDLPPGSIETNSAAHLI